jgi:hypothetical protein
MAETISVNMAAPGASSSSRVKNSRSTTVTKPLNKQENNQTDTYLSEEDKKNLNAIYERMKTVQEKIANRTETGKGSNTFREDKDKYAQDLKKFRDYNQEVKNYDDTQTQNRSMVDGIIKNLGSITAGVVGHATDTSVGDKFKYDSYDPIIDNRAAEFKANSADKSIVDKYKAYADGLDTQQKNELDSLEQEFKSLRDQANSYGKFADKTKYVDNTQNKEVLGTESQSTEVSKSDKAAGSSGVAGNYKDVTISDTWRKKLADASAVLTNTANVYSDKPDAEVLNQYEKTIRQFDSGIADLVNRSTKAGFTREDINRFLNLNFAQEPNNSEQKDVIDAWMNAGQVRNAKENEAPVNTPKIKPAPSDPTPIEANKGTKPQTNNKYKKFGFQELQEIRKDSPEVQIANGGMSGRPKSDESLTFTETDKNGKKQTYTLSKKNGVFNLKGGGKDGAISEEQFNTFFQKYKNK